jgi:hypothetical protein
LSPGVRRPNTEARGGEDQMGAAALRAAFAAFLGDAKFRKFVRQGFHRGRLRYWQQEEWDRFLSAHPEFSVSMGELEAALRICELHDEELLPDTAEVFRGNLDYADWYIEARNRLFPHAAEDMVATEGAPISGERVAVFYCPACRAAKAEWQARHR